MDTMGITIKKLLKTLKDIRGVREVILLPEIYDSFITYLYESEHSEYGSGKVPALINQGNSIYIYGILVSKQV